jgi:hypothetical protein
MRAWTHGALPSYLVMTELETVKEQLMAGSHILNISENLE